MSTNPSTDEPTEDSGEAPVAPHAGSPGVSGQGADSALARLRQMERQRDDEALKPDRDDA